jgi:UDP-N-acetylglucosamine 2-epimerase (non-hydrolysing)
MGSKAFLIVVGTRPDIIKMAPLVHEMERCAADFAVLFTSQHFTESMGINMLEEANYPKEVLRVTPRFSTGEVQRAMIPFDTVLVYGDTMSAGLAGLSAIYMGKKLVHVEAGLRSFDFRMREERIRRMLDHGSDVLLCPCKYHLDGLAMERVQGRAYVSGNLIVDALAGIVSLKDTGEVLITLHRPELVHSEEFVPTLTAIDRYLGTRGLSGVFPVHPATRPVLENIIKPKNIRLTNPMRARKSWATISEAPFVVTDSGGIQEEACILGVPCFTVRPSTERMETVDCGANCLIHPSTDVEEMLSGFSKSVFKTSWKHPYGENVAKNMMKILKI